MAYRNAQTAYRTLVQVAQGQGGYVTAQQARRAGFDYSHLAYHVRVGNLTRAGHGLYRLPEIPSSEHDQVLRLVLGSRNRSGQAQAVVSHASALALHQLSDVIPTSTHLTVPPSWRKAPPAGATIHRGAVPPSDVEEWDGFSVTTPLRTLVDVAAERRLSREQLGRAVADALSRGLVRRSELTATLRATDDEKLRERLTAAMPSRR
jgi:predicted transcriptional regulator of viral defense system